MVARSDNATGPYLGAEPVRGAVLHLSTVDELAVRAVARRALHDRQVVVRVPHARGVAVDRLVVAGVAAAHLAAVVLVSLVVLHAVRPLPGPETAVFGC